MRGPRRPSRKKSMQSGSKYFLREAQYAHSIEKALVVLIWLSVITLSAFAETVKCSECGMTCDVAAKFTAKIDHDGTFYFCDIGDLLMYLKRKTDLAAFAQVKDYKTGEWIGAVRAYFVQSGKRFKTPMGWGIAPFKNKEQAAEFGGALDFSGIMKALK